MPGIGGEQTPVSKDGFLFLGNLLVLDFLNTRPVSNNEPLELLPDFGALLNWFRAAGVIDSGAVTRLEHWERSPTASRVMRAMRSLREKLRKEVLSWEQGTSVQGGTLHELNQLLAKYPMRAKLLGGKKSSLRMQLYCEARKPEDLFAPVVHSAAILFSAIDRSRVRKCDQCVLHFYDISKKGTRRWCSMQLCGNRLKVAAYAARKRSAKNN